MLKLKQTHLDALNHFSVHVDSQNKVLLTVADLLTDSGLTKMYAEIHDLTGAPTNAVATSIYMRRHGFFIAAQLHLMSEFNVIWTGKRQDISLIVEKETLIFSVPSRDFKQIEDREEAIRFILESYGHPIVEFLSKEAKVAKLILWENVWGYVIWMYSMLLKDNSEFAQLDLDVLLLDETWKPAMRRSPFKQYLNNQHALEAMANYKRTTCCLLKELPDTEKCPYCPLAK